MVSNDSTGAGFRAGTLAEGDAQPDAAAIRVYETTEEDWRIWRALRLEALADAPYAFGETLERSLERDEDSWRSWWRPDPVSPRFIALVDGVAAAMSAICFPDDHGNEPLLISMWASPKARGRGAARAMLDACADYCVRTGHRRLLLGVVEDNLPALRLYERYGFARTGGSEPLLSDPSKQVLWMEKALPQV
jgi:ribosomal protein S18 acetylase RimI-like enzyme